MTAEIGIVRETPLAPPLRHSALLDLSPGAQRYGGAVSSKVQRIKSAKFFGAAMARPVLPAQAVTQVAVSADEHGVCKRRLPNQILVDWAKDTPREKGGFARKTAALPRLPRSAFMFYQDNLEAEVLSDFPMYLKDGAAWAVERRKIAKIARAKFVNLLDVDKDIYAMLERADVSRYETDKIEWLSAHPGEMLPTSHLEKLVRRQKANRNPPKTTPGAVSSKKAKTGSKKAGTTKPKVAKSNEIQSMEEVELETDADDLDSTMLDVSLQAMSDSESEHSSRDEHGEEDLEEEDAEGDEEVCTKEEEQTENEEPASQQVSTRRTRSSSRLSQRTPPTAPQCPVFNVDSKAGRPATPHKCRRLSGQQLPLGAMDFNAAAAETQGAGIQRGGTQELSFRYADPALEHGSHTVIGDGLAAGTVPANMVNVDAAASQQAQHRSRSAGGRALRSAHNSLHAIQERSQWPTRSRGRRHARSNNAVITVAAAATMQVAEPAGHAQPTSQIHNLDDLSSAITFPANAKKPRR